jgi:hypothetical protein
MKRLLFFAFSMIALSLASSCARRMPCPAYTQNSPASAEKSTETRATALSEAE